ncbi:hypothetical protein FRX31_013081 [Thalictrum thalictroides]|uniref:Uncharacterized protein n=1 Tax=Thalictrum thalictroides TaxID=46969 RepID=A0A7J6WK48_THATH|nr:hypothetical protein FRX31_013081 [Thalictrum thalictroides]
MDTDVKIMKISIEKEEYTHIHHIPTQKLNARLIAVVTSTNSQTKKTSVMAPWASLTTITNL